MRDTINVTAPMPSELERQARIHASLLGISRSKLIRLALADYLERNPVDLEGVLKPPTDWAKHEKITNTD